VLHTQIACVVLTMSSPLLFLSVQLPQVPSWAPCVCLVNVHVACCDVVMCDPPAKAAKFTMFRVITIASSPIVENVSLPFSPSSESSHLCFGPRLLYKYSDPGPLVQQKIYLHSPSHPHSCSCHHHSPCKALLNQRHRVTLSGITPKMMTSLWVPVHP
jgi:hypothetical protein